MTNTLLNKTVKELRTIAKDLGMKGYTRLPKEELINAIINGVKVKAQEQEEIVNNIANVHKLANDIAKLEAPSNTTWTRTTGEHDHTIITRALTKLIAETPVTFNKDTILNGDDKLPVVSSKGKKSMLTVAKILELASQIKEEVKNEDDNRELSKEDIEMLNTIKQAKIEQAELNKQREEYFKLKREQEKQERTESARNQLKDKVIYGDDFFEKLVNVTNVACYLQETRYARRFDTKYRPVSGQIFIMEEVQALNTLNRVKKISNNRYLKYTGAELYNQDIKTLAILIKNSFDTQNLASNENFEKNTEYAKLIENVLIKTNTFDYKEKDSFVNSPEDIADVLLAEQKENSFRNKVAYHNREIAKRDNKLKPASERQLTMIDNMRFAYYKKHKTFPMLPVQSYAQITSSVLASAIIEKYEEYCQEQVVTHKMAKKLFDRMVKWNIANSTQEVAFVRNLRINYSFEEVKTVLNITYTDMWLIKKYAEANKLKIVEASLKVANMKESTRYSAVQYYRSLELNQRIKLYNVEDDK